LVTRDIEPSRTVIVLGASNVARGLGTAYCTVRAVCREPLDFLVAAGHGRSFGQESSYFGRVLPGILDCGLWPSVSQLPGRAVTALITDVGNDLAYGVSPATIEGWVDECLLRLAELRAATILTQLPLESLTRLGPRRFRFFRRLLFPRATFELADILAMVAEMNERLREVASRHGATLLTPSGDWFGLDPIHIRRRSSVVAWRTMWSAARLDHEPSIDTIGGAWTRWKVHRMLQNARPMQQLRRGRSEQCEQPALRLRDGSRVWSF